MITHKNYVLKINNIDFFLGAPPPCNHSSALPSCGKAGEFMVTSSAAEDQEIS